MRRIIVFLFGKPYDNKAWKFFYWFGVIPYFIIIPINMAVAFFVIETDTFLKVSSIIVIILYPFLFRLVYSMNAFFCKMLYSDMKKVD